MKPTAVLLGLALLCPPATAALSQTPQPSAAITVTRTSDGWDITLPPSIAKTVTDQYWLVVDGKVEGFGGQYYNPEFITKMPLHYRGQVSDDLDGQVKDILKAQGFSVKPNVITYHIAAGLDFLPPDGTPHPLDVSISQTLHFRHGSIGLVFTDFPRPATYRVGDKITLIDAVMPDSSITMQQALGPNNDISSGKFAPLPNDLLHRITIQVQFVPKTP